jgi:hypothetical protein
MLDERAAVILNVVRVKNIQFTPIQFTCCHSLSARSNANLRTPIRIANRMIHMATHH